METSKKEVGGREREREIEDNSASKGVQLDLDGVEVNRNRRDIGSCSVKYWHNPVGGRADGPPQ